MRADRVRGNASVAPLLPDSKQLEFRDGDLSYRDVYVGMQQCVGQEIVYRANRAVWSMSYSGGVTEPLGDDEARALYAFLRAALRAMPSETPLRGPAQVAEGELTYRTELTGDLAQFAGTERIAHRGRTRYELHYAGGLIR